MKILIATKNASKLQGAREAFATYFGNFEIEGIPVESNVPEEPINEEIMQGAENRVKNLVKYAKANNIEADYFLSVESGLTKQLGRWLNISIAIVRDKYGYESVGTSPAYPVPEKYVDEIIKTDLEKLFTKIFNQDEINTNKGGVRLLTHGQMTRADLIMEAFLMALTQVVNGSVWRDD